MATYDITILCNVYNTTIKYKIEKSAGVTYLEGEWKCTKTSYYEKLEAIPYGYSVKLSCSSYPDISYTYDYWERDSSPSTRIKSDSVTFTLTKNVSYAFYVKKKQYTITPAVNNKNYGSTNPSVSFYANYEDSITVNDNVVTIGSTTVTASPFSDTSEWDYYFNSWSNTSGTITANRTITANFGCRKQSYTVTLNGNGGTFDGNVEYTYPSKVTYGSTVSNLKKPTHSDGVENHTAKFYDDSSYIFSRQIPCKLKYTYSGYNNSGTGSGSTSVTVTGTTYLKAIWNTTLNAASISDFPSNYTKSGYKFNGWYTDPSGGTKITASTKFSEDTNVYASLVPNVYQVKYNLRSGESWAGEKPSQLYFYKTFDEATSLISDKVQRIGYTFKGWCEQKKIINAHGETVKHTYAPGAEFDDAIYIDNNYQGPINLYPWFEPIDNKVTYKYYTNDNVAHDEVETYNIENTLMIDQPYKKGDPTIQFVPGDNDYTFLGWTDKKPEGKDREWVWGDGSDKGKGLFLNPEEVKDCYEPLNPRNPLEIIVTKKTEWGTNVIYYGLWTKTGKYAKTKDGWKKISTMYIMSKEANESEPTWKTVTDVWVKTEDGWKHEI